MQLWRLYGAASVSNIRRTVSIGANHDIQRGVGKRRKYTIVPHDPDASGSDGANGPFQDQVIN